MRRVSTTTFLLAQSVPRQRQQKQQQRRQLNDDLPTKYLKCPSCGRPLQSALPICLSCRFIGPVPPTSLDQLLGLGLSENSFQIDYTQLKRAFLDAQRVCHPDAWRMTGEAQTSLAVQYSSLVNHAYNTLRDPLSRAHYLISQRGQLELNEDDKLQDSELILQVMDTRELIDDASIVEELDIIERENQERMQKTIKLVASQIEQREWTRAKEAAIELKYWRGIDDAISEKRLQFV